MGISRAISWKRHYNFLLIATVMLFCYMIHYINFWVSHSEKYFPDRDSKAVSDNKSWPQFEKAERQRPIIWVDGIHRSGTTLMRVLLDTDPNINCGPEPKFFTSFLGYIHQQIERVTCCDIAIFHFSDLY